jgi:hypothetical protein
MSTGPGTRGRLPLSRKKGVIGGLLPASVRPSASDIGSHAAGGDDTRANVNGGASSPGASDLLFAKTAHAGHREGLGLTVARALTEGGPAASTEAVTTAPPSALLL